MFLIGILGNLNLDPQSATVKKMGKKEWPRWQSKKTLTSPPPTGTTKSQLFTEQLLMRTT